MKITTHEPGWAAWAGWQIRLQTLDGTPFAEHSPTFICGACAEVDVYVEIQHGLRFVVFAQQPSLTPTSGRDPIPSSSPFGSPPPFPFSGHFSNSDWNYRTPSHRSLPSHHSTDPSFPGSPTQPSPSITGGLFKRAQACDRITPLTSASTGPRRFPTSPQPVPAPVQTTDPEYTPATLLRYFTDDLDLGGVVYLGTQTEPLVEDVVFQNEQGAMHTSAMRFQVDKASGYDDALGVFRVKLKHGGMVCVGVGEATQIKLVSEQRAMVSTRPRTGVGTDLLDEAPATYPIGAFKRSMDIPPLVINFHLGTRLQLLARGIITPVPEPVKREPLAELPLPLSPRLQFDVQFDTLVEEMKDRFDDDGDKAPSPM